MNAPTGNIMPDTRWLNKAFEWFPPGTSKRSAPRITWRNYMTENIRKRNIDDDSWNAKNGSVSYKKATANKWRGVQMFVYCFYLKTAMYCN